MMIDEFRKLIDEMRSILQREGEQNWIRGINAIRNTLSLDNPDSENLKFSNAKNAYFAMTRGAGSFSDYYIKRDSSYERIKANKRLDEIRDRIWTILTSDS